MNRSLARYTVSVFIVLAWLKPFPGYGQFLTVQIDVEPEVETLIERHLDFGEIASNSGLQSIEGGSPNMGIFKIRALRTQRLILSLEADQELISENPEDSATIPLHIEASYTHNGVEDYQASTPLADSREMIIIEGTPRNPLAAWSGVYLYIYGDLDIGNIPIGNYTGTIILSVIYE